MTRSQSFGPQLGQRCSPCGIVLLATRHIGFVSGYAGALTGAGGRSRVFEQDGAGFGEAPTKGSTSLNGEAVQNSVSYKFPDKLGPLMISSTYVASQHQAFRAVVGHEAGSGCEKIKFEVFADQERVDQQVVARDQTARINAPVGGHTKLKLQMTGLNRDNQDAFCGATAVWGDAELI